MTTASTPATASASTMLPLSSSKVSPPTRPKFHHQNTQDRLREGAGLYVALFKTNSNLQKGRRSVFKEMGLDSDLSNLDTEMAYASPSSVDSAPSMQDLHPYPSGSDARSESSTGDKDSMQSKSWYSSNDNTISPELSPHSFLINFPLACPQHVEPRDAGVRRHYIMATF
ncbi:hypothetical protein PT974_11508 [Cladobotryum mycophilum]|uniref:Uncharacterized protein n=1 Tax=Cladobotryum mycophilum TaxID=491253 RepID=A0ABR0S6S6_9HYPO